MSTFLQPESVEKNHTHTHTHTYTWMCTQNFIKTALIMRLIHPIKPVCELKSRKPVVFSTEDGSLRVKGTCDRVAVIGRWSGSSWESCWCEPMFKCWRNWCLLFMSELRGSTLKHYSQLPHFSAFCSNWTWACWAGPLRPGAGLTSSSFSHH